MASSTCSRSIRCWFLNNGPKPGTTEKKQNMKTKIEIEIDMPDGFEFVERYRMNKSRMIIVAESILDVGIKYFRELNLADWTKVDAHAYHVCEIPLTSAECDKVREVCLKYIADAGKSNLEDLFYAK